MPSERHVRVEVAGEVAEHRRTDMTIDGELEARPDTPLVLT